MSILKRIEGERFSEVVMEWGQATCVVIAGGPSLSAREVDRVGELHKGSGWLRAIAVNDAYLLAPWADVCYFADGEWWRWHTKGIARPGFSADQVRERFAAFAGQKCSIRWSGMNVEDESVHIVKNKYGEHSHGEGISLDPRCLVSGKNSGFQAINLAILAGAKRILLLGIDGAPDKLGRNHWFGENPRNVQWAVFYEYMRRTFASAENQIKAAGVEVINCNPTSFIDHFPKMTLEKALA